MVCKCGAKLEICLIEGQLGERAGAEGWRSRHRRRRTDSRRGGLTRTVGLSLLSAFSIASRFAPPDIFFLYDYYEVELRERLNLVTPWPTMLNVRVRRQIDAETKSSFPATLADTESTCSIDDSHHKVVYA